MKENILHIVAGYGYTLNRGLSMQGINANIVTFPSMFEEGYLPKDLSDKELCFYLQSLNLSPDEFRQRFDELKQFVSYDYTMLDKVVIWHGNHVNELMLLFFMCHLTDAKLFHIDMTLGGINGLEKENSIGLGHFSPNDIAKVNWMNDVMKPISIQEKNEFALLWRHWVNIGGFYRRYNKSINNIEILPDTFMDTEIHNQLQKESRFGLIIARLMGKFEDFGDKIISDRLLSFWHSRRNDFEEQHVSLKPREHHI